MLARLPSGLYTTGTTARESQRRWKAAAGPSGLPRSGVALPFADGTAMQSILNETQDVELLVATALTAAGYLIGAVVFLTALL